MSGYAGVDQYRLAYQISPIVLVGGVASGANGNAALIINYTGGQPSGTDYFAEYIPIPGGTLINNIIATYPFANQQVAANAIIQNPNVLSMKMIAPVNTAGGYMTKLAAFTSLQNTLQLHNISGGMYNIATPAFLYTNGVMTGMTCLQSESSQAQIIWQLDFFFPLITLQQAAAAQSSLISNQTSGQQITGDPTWSGPATATGTAAPGATQGTSGKPAAVNNFPATISS